MLFRAAILSSLATLAVSAAADEPACVPGIAVPAGGDYSEWPELFRLTDEYPEDPTLSGKDETADLVDPEILVAAGVGYFFLDPEGYDYPEGKEIPWEPPVNGTNDPDLEELRDAGDYQYADVVVVTAYNEKFYEEHIHPGGDEIRYIIDGSGYFDIRDVNDEWVRMAANAGDLIVFPAGIEHRFSVDQGLYIQAMRLFPGSDDPDWSSISRSEHAMFHNSTARDDYVDAYLCGVDPDKDNDHGHGHEDHGAEDEKDGGNDSEATDFVHEWAAVFPMADASHQYLMQEVDGSYADPSMRVVLIPTTELNIEGIHTTEAAVAALMEGDSCETIENGGTGSAIAETGSCYELVVDTTTDTNTFNLVTEGLVGLAVYTQHVPYEFEDDMHFLKDSAGADIEPVAEESVGGHGHGHGHGSHGSDDEVSGAASFGGLIGSALVGAVVAAAL